MHRLAGLVSELIERLEKQDRLLLRMHPAKRAKTYQPRNGIIAQQSLRMTTVKQIYGEAVARDVYYPAATGPTR